MFWSTDRYTSTRKPGSRPMQKSIEYCRKVGFTSLSSLWRTYFYSIATGRRRSIILACHIERAHKPYYIDIGLHLDVNEGKYYRTMLASNVMDPINNNITLKYVSGELISLASLSTFESGRYWQHIPKSDRYGNVQIRIREGLATRATVLLSQIALSIVIAMFWYLTTDVSNKASKILKIMFSGLMILQRDLGTVLFYFMLAILFFVPIGFATH